MTAVPDLLASFAGDTQDEVDATAVIRSACGWHVAGLVTETIELDVDGGRVLALPTLRLTAVVSVVDTVTGAPVAGWDPVRGWSRSGLLRHATGWPVGFRAVTATFTHGYQDVPDDLAAAARSLAKHINPDMASAPVASFTKTQGSRTLTKAFAVSEVAKLVGQMSFVERLVLERYSLGPLP